MNAAFHTDPSSSPEGDVRVTAPQFSENGFWGADLAFRIWLWLSQLCAFQLTVCRAPLAARLLRSTQLRGAYTPFQMAQQAATQPHKARPNDARPHDARPHDSAPLAPRHERRVAARQARGIIPIGRYTRHYIRQYFAAGMSAKQALAYARRLSPLLAVKDFVRFCPRFLSLIHDSGRPQTVRHCGAPLAPD